jgi:hypothetical protein
MQPIKRLNNTYQKLYRNRHLIAKDLMIGDAEYRLWDLYIALYDWDKTHAETFETVNATDSALAEILNWSKSKVCRTRKKLLKKGVIRFIERSLYKIISLPREETISVSLQSKSAELQDEVAQINQKGAVLQPNQGYSTQNTIVSYKDKYRINSEDEYKRVKINVDGLSKQIDRIDCWLSEKPEEKALVDKQQRNANLMLDYEIENGLLPI